MRLDKTVIREYARLALEEDAAFSDVTTLDFIPKNVEVEAVILTKESGVVCGLALVSEIFALFDKKARARFFKKDGERVSSGTCLALIKGRARTVLSCERVALNFLSRLSGIATQTAEVVRAVRGKGIRVLDTRKTTPLLRLFEKYAVECGGGTNHRFDLSKQYLVKDNHLAVLKAAGGLAVLENRDTGIPFEIEVASLPGLAACLPCVPDIVMLDNFSPRRIKAAVDLLRRRFPAKDRRPLVEVSGGVTAKNIRCFAIPGVDFISLGALTHSVRSLDVSLEITKVRPSSYFVPVNKIKIPLTRCSL